MSTVVNIMAALALAAWAGFALTYHVRAAWYATPQGRNIMGVSVALASLLALVVVAKLWPEFDRTLFQVFVYGWLTYLGAERLGQMLRLQRQTRDARRANEVSTREPREP